MNGRTMRAVALLGALVLGAAVSCDDWGDLEDMPAGFADNVDNDTVVTAGDGLTETSGELSVDFAGTGTDPTAARSDHTHSEYVLKAGDTMTGELNASAGITTTSVAYSAPRTHYVQVPAEAFHTRANSSEFTYHSSGGVYLPAGTNAQAVAPISLPHGATVVSMYAWFHDSVADELDIRLRRCALNGTTGEVTVAYVPSNGDSGDFMRPNNPFIPHEVDLFANNYYVSAYSSNWSASLRLRSVVVGYMITEEP